MTHLSRFAFKRATSEKWSYQHHHGWQLGRGGGRGRGTTPLMLGHFWCTKAAGTYWILHCPVLGGGVPRNAALMIPAHFSQPPVNTGQPDIFNTFAWHWNGLFASPFKPILTQNDIIIHLDYIFSQSICSKGINQQAEWRDIQQACYGLCCVICYMSEITSPTESALLGSYYSYEQFKSLQVGVANVKSAVVCVWHLIKDVVSSHHQQPDTIIADVIRIDKYLPGGASCKSKIFGKFCIHSKAICFIIRTS